VLRANKLADAYVRPIAWRGSEQMGVAAQQTKTNVAIAAWDWGSYFDPAARAKGLRLRFGDFRRPDPRTAPVTSKATGLYMICTIEKHKAEREGYNDALMLDWRGQIAEATGANVFFVKDGVLHTPLPDCFLNGITRQTVIQLARSLGFEVIERHIKPEELADFTECFITGSAAEVTAVSEIGADRFTPGTVTFTLAEEYSRLVRRERELTPA
jgi:branched-chain amino acid aminotransferase